MSKYALLEITILLIIFTLTLGISAIISGFAISAFFYGLVFGVNLVNLFIVIDKYYRG